MVSMRKDWGDLARTYGRPDSQYGHIPAIGCVIDPDSAFSTYWDIAQVVFLVYVAIFVPMRACFQYDTQLFSAMWVVDTIVDVYFIVDLFLNCITAYDDFGIRVTLHSEIIKHYLRTWFIFDLVACVPVQYIAMMIESSSDVDTVSRTILIPVRVSSRQRLLWAGGELCGSQGTAAGAALEDAAPHPRQAHPRQVRGYDLHPAVPGDLRAALLHDLRRPLPRLLLVSCCHDIAGIWVALFSRCQRYSYSLRTGTGRTRPSTTWS